MTLFFTPNIDENTKSTLLSEEDARHAVQVLRKKVGDTVGLIDGKGGSYTGIILEAEKKKVIVQIRNYALQPKRNYRLHIAIAPTKNIDRTEWFVEKAIELGIDEISFIQTHRSERSRIKKDRISRIAIAACKQSKNAYMPTINQLEPLPSFLKEKRSGVKKYIAHCLEEGQGDISEIELEKGSDTLFLVGPEGDFSEQEIAWALNEDYKPISLGRSRLRTETAGIAISAAMRFRKE